MEKDKAQLRESFKGFFARLIRIYKHCIILYYSATCKNVTNFERPLRSLKIYSNQRP